MARTILIVDDDPVQRRLLQSATEKHKFRARPVENGEQALEEAVHPANGVDAVLLDLVMPGLSGMEVLQQLMQKRPELPVIVLTASAGIDTAVKAMRSGAVDFLIKPAAPERIAASIRNALRLSSLSGEVKRLSRKADNAMNFKDMIGSAPALRSAAAMGGKAAKSSIPVLILGESGTGKEVMARCIQGSSGRAGQPFIPVNCGAIPENLVESTLFGHEKGAFTGASEKRSGKFREADGGTLFLDEVGELPADTQTRLLRALQEGEIEPVGAAKPVKVDVRILSATNRDLESSVKNGDFREDLYYRLNVFPLSMPPLRQRLEDLPDLVEHFIQRFNADEGRRVQGIQQEALELLSSYDWPGNIRQLENSVFRAIVLCETEQLGKTDFPQIEAKISPRNSPCHCPGLLRSNGSLRPFRSIERDLIRMAIESCAGSASEAARQMRLSSSSDIYRKLHNFANAPAQGQVSRRTEVERPG